MTEVESTNGFSIHDFFSGNIGITYKENPVVMTAVGTAARTDV